MAQELARLVAPPLPDRPKQCDVYVIDTGRDTAVRQLIDATLTQCPQCLANHNVYVLTADQSCGVLQGTPALQGQDPIILVLDSDARAERPLSGFGFRYCLGAIAEHVQVQRMLDHLVHILRVSQRAADVVAAIRHEIRQCGGPEAASILPAN